MEEIKEVCRNCVHFVDDGDICILKDDVVWGDPNLEIDDDCIDGFSPKILYSNR